MSTEDDLHVGDKWEPLFTMKHRGTLADPTAVSVAFQDPAGAVTTVSASKEATGEWSAAKTVDKEGTWHATATASGAYVGVETLSRDVLKAPTI